MKTLSRPLRLGARTIPAACLGTMTWGRQTPPAEAHRQIDLALDHGLNFLDTAEMYPTNPVRPETLGGTEAILGDWIAANGRDRLVLATKVTGEGSGVMPGGTPPITPARMRQAVEGSLRRLRTDHIDLYQLHWPNRGSYHFRKNWTFRPATDAAAFRAHVLDILTEAAALIAEGKIGTLGLSNESAWGLAQWLNAADRHGLPRIAAVQNEYSPLCRLADTDMAEALAMEDIPLLAFSPLAAGLLTGKYAGDTTPEGSRRAATPDLGGRVTARVHAAVQAWHRLAHEAGLDPVVMALAWQATRPFTAVPILGATTRVQLERQMPALSLELGADLVAAIDRLNATHPMPY